MIGETLSHFKITDKLGQGGMGVVYRAVDLNLDRPVAIKILPPEAQQDEDSIGRFLREAKTASKLQHPAITTIYEFGVKDNLRYLVMEYIEGKTLREMLKNGPLTIRQTLDIAVQLADALVVAGEKNIIHRDIKSENIMVTERGQVKILDFGLAKMTEKTGPVTDTFHTAVGFVMGTVSYMSPEQALGADLDGRTDIYSTGVVLYEMASGSLPFTGNSTNVVLAKVLNQAAPPPSSINRDVPPQLERIITKCLEKNRDQRYRTAVELMSDLRSVKQRVETDLGLGGTMVAPKRTDALGSVESLSDLIPGATQPVGGTGAGAATARAPGSGQYAAATGAIASSGAIVLPGPVQAQERDRKLRWCSIIGRSRSAFSIVTGLYVAACVILFILPLLKIRQAHSMTAIQMMKRGIDPAIAFLIDTVDFNFIYKDFNFAFLIVALGVYIVQQIVTGRLDRMEGRVRMSLARAASVAPYQVGQVPSASAGQTTGQRELSRTALLRDYMAARRLLSDAKKELAFLAIDVVGSTKMKIGEEKLTIEHAFAEYKKLLEEIFRDNNVYKVAWTPDGVMTCFPSVDDAANAGQKVLVRLVAFNRHAHSLKTPFHVRVGVNFGEVMIPEAKPLEEVSDETIDVAGHMQKYAEPDEMWIASEVYQLLSDKTGFRKLETRVDNREVYAWRQPPPA